MYYQDIIHNCGKGNRVVLMMATPSSGLSFGVEETVEILQEMADTDVSGLTITGEEPLMEHNIHLLTELCKVCKEDYPNKTIWCDTGFQDDTIKDLNIMKYIDVVHHTCKCK